MAHTYKDVLQFWFEELEAKDWFNGNTDLDSLIHQRFKSLHLQASRCELYEWRSSAQGRLAEIIILDQFSRNLYRDSASAFAFDSQALALAQEAVALEMDKALPPEQCTFLYMPYMHSESLLIHECGLQLFVKNGLQSNIDYHRQHTVILEKFGRYPHRNRVLGRESSEEEILFLTQPGSSF